MTDDRRSGQERRNSYRGGRRISDDLQRAQEMFAESRRLDAEAKALVLKSTTSLQDHFTPQHLATLSGLSYVAVWRDIDAKEIPGVIWVTRRSQRRAYIPRESAVLWLVKIGMPEKAESISSITLVSPPDNTSEPAA